MRRGNGSAQPRVRWNDRNAEEPPRPTGLHSAASVAVMIAAVVVSMVLIGGVIALLIGAGLARRAWR